MARPHVVVSIFPVLAAVLGAGAACAQAYPVKPIRFLTTGVGAGTDLAARTVALGLIENAGWNVIVDNRGARSFPRKSHRERRPTVTACSSRRTACGAAGTFRRCLSIRSGISLRSPW